MNIEEIERRSIEANARFFKRLFNALYSKWWFFISACIISLGSAFLYIRYTPKIYQIEAQIIIKNPDEKLDPSKLLFNANANSSNKELANELIVIKSFGLISKSIQDLGQNIHYYRTTKALERLINIDEEEAPFTASIPSIIDSNYVDLSLSNPVVLKMESSSTYNLFNTDDELIMKGVFGDTIHVNGLPIVIQSKSNRLSEIQESDVLYMFSVSSIYNTTRYYQSALNVIPTDENSTAISLNLQGELVEREKRFLNNLLKNYIEANLEEKNIGASNTINFITRELNIIRDSLQKIEARIEVFKSDNRIGNLASEAERSFASLLKLEEEKASALLSEKYMAALESYLKSDNVNGLIAPSTFGLSDPTLGKLIDQILVLESEKRMLGNSSENNVRNQIEARLQSLKTSLLEFRQNFELSNRIKINDINARIQQVETAISGIPSSELSLMNIQRLQKLSESLYLLLMEKKAEAEISRSSNKPDIKIVDEPRISSYLPVKPRKNIIYILSIFLGLGVPFGLILISVYLDNTIRAKEDIVSELSIPFVGYVPKSESDQRDFVLSKPKSSLAESIRTIRSNLRYLLNETGSKSIVVTSCFPGEGKTFFSANMTMSLALANRSVLVIGADLRKPQLQLYFNCPNNLGLSSYLAGYSKLEDCIIKHSSGVHIIPSGPIPPNPLEMLDSEIFKNLVESLKLSYDFVVIDTSPFALVADAKNLFNNSDINIIVLRSGVSKLDNLKIINEMLETRKNQGKFCSVLNDHNFINEYGYGRAYRSGYGYYE